MPNGGDYFWFWLASRPLRMLAMREVETWGIPFRSIVMYIQTPAARMGSRFSRPFNIRLLNMIAYSILLVKY
jgi:hypothetical protein